MKYRLSTAVLLAALGAVPAFAQTAPPGPPTPPPAPADAPRPDGPPDDGPAADVQGVVLAYNFDPHGSVNSIELKVGRRGIAQFKVPRDEGSTVAAAAVIGQTVTANGVPERVLPDRTLYRLNKLTTADGKAISFGPPGTETPTHVEGSVRRLNVSPRGEVDGAVLESGDYVHTGPDSAADLEVGTKLTADGPAHPMADGHRAIEATTLNGNPVHHPKKGPKPPPPPEDGDDKPKPLAP